MFKKTRRYYSTRSGKLSDQKITLDDMKSMFISFYESLEGGGHFQEYFGYCCVDAGEVPGLLGNNIPAIIRFHLRKDNLWPIKKHIAEYSEDDMFDIIEFLYDHISKPLDGYYHQFGDCGYHYSSFDGDSGRQLYREQLNILLEDYSEGYELNSQGEILACGPHGTAFLLQADVPSKDENIRGRINNAILIFRRYKSTFDDRRHAIRDLADVLEYLRPAIKSIITKQDESDLFNIANNFGIRHHKEDQKSNYDKSIWYSWMFYYYLATIHACLRLIEKAGQHRSP